MGKKTVEQRLQELQIDVKKILEILSEGAKKASPDSLDADQEATMSIKEAADFLQMEVTAIVEKCQKGEIPYAKDGRLMTIKKLDLIAWVRDRKGTEKWIN